MNMSLLTVAHAHVISNHKASYIEYINKRQYLLVSGLFDFLIGMLEAILLRG